MHRKRPDDLLLSSVPLQSLKTVMDVSLNTLPLLCFPLSPYLAPLSSALLFHQPLLLSALLSFCTSRVGRRKRRKKGRRVGVKRGTHPLPPSSSLACSDVAQVIRPLHRVPTATWESRIAGKDNDGWRDVEGRGQERGRKNGWT